MAKKTVKDNSVRPGYKQHASKRCKEEDCMGCPKKLIEAKTFDGTICSKCFAVHEFKIQEEIDNQEKLDIKEEKVKKKTLTTSEKELEKAIKEADAMSKKKIKPKADGEQLNLL